MAATTYICQEPIKHDGERYAVGSDIALEDKHAQPLLARRAIAKPDTTPESEAGDRPPRLMADIINAIGSLESGNPAHWTKDGKPEVKALSTILGRVITAGQRDEAWAILQKNDKAD